MVMYANEVETKEKEKLPEIKVLTTTCTIQALRLLEVKRTGGSMAVCLKNVISNDYILYSI